MVPPCAATPLAGFHTASVSRIADTLWKSNTHTREKVRKQRRQAEADDEPLVKNETGHLEGHGQGRRALLLPVLLDFLRLPRSLRCRCRLHATITVGGLGLGVSRGRAHDSYGQRRGLCLQQHGRCLTATFPKAKVEEEKENQIREADAVRKIRRPCR
jgi:hypothetical protein